MTTTTIRSTSVDDSVDDEAHVFGDISVSITGSVMMTDEGMDTDGWMDG